MGKKSPDKKQILLDYLKTVEKLEESQLEAVTSTEKLISVSAGAGSGKTLTLAWRFIWIASALSVPLNNILTITFTEKAASEMKERIERILKKLANDIPPMSDTFKNLLERIDDAYISTIHSFSMRVMKECGLSLDLDPNARVITNAENAALWLSIERALDYQEAEAIIDQLPQEWKERARETLNSPRLLDLLNTFGAEAIASSAKSFMSSHGSKGTTPEDAWEMTENLEETDEKTKSLLIKRFFEDWRSAQKMWIEELIPYIKSKIDLKKDKAKFSKRLLMLESTWKTPINEENAADFIISLWGEDGPLKALHNGNAKRAADEFLEDAINMTARDYRESNKTWLQVAQFIKNGSPAEEKMAREALIKTFAVLWKYVQTIRYRRGILSFDDLIRFALRVLQDDEKYAERFTHVLVDEFQDTDGLQDLMLKAIKEKGASSLFIVGDLQQSIYRFRHAQPKIFWEYIKDSQHGSDVKPINLDISFRSREAVMEKVNNMFSKIWPYSIAKDIQKRFMALKAPTHHEWWPRRQKSTMEPFKIFIAACPSDKENKVNTNELRSTSLEALGNFIAESVATGKTIWDKDEEGNFAHRPVRYRDFAILVPTRTQYEAIEKAFIETLQLPVYFEGNRSFYSRGETKDIAYLLKALARPNDHLAMASFLSSPLSGLSLEDASSLIKLCEKGKSALSELFRQNHPQKWEAFMRLRKVAKVKGASWALASLLEEGTTLLSYPRWKRRRIAANLRKAIDVVREYENYVDPSLEGAAAYIERATYQGADMQEADILGDNDDMIRVMTVHAAKGLEFPVVAVTGLEYAFGNKNDSILPSQWLGVTLSKLPEEWVPEKEQKLLSKDIHSIFEAQELLEEQERLLYVACTRAKDSLILCGICHLDQDNKLKPKKNSWLELISPNLEDLGDESSLTILSPPEEKTQNKTYGDSGKDKPSPGPTIILGKEPVSEGLFLEHITASIYSLYNFCPHAYRMKYRQGLDIPWESATDDGRGGSDVGSLAHWLLKEWDYTEESLNFLLPENPKQLEEQSKIIPPYLRAPYRDSSTVKEIKKWLYKLLDSPLASKVKAARKVMKELPFQVGIGNKTQMTGYMDLVLEENGAFSIIDYKISAPEEGSRALYRDQLIFYGVALWKITAEAPSLLGIYHLPEAVMEEVPLNSLNFEEEEGKIAEVASLAAHGPFKPERSNCKICPWRGSCTAMPYSPKREETS